MTSQFFLKFTPPPSDLRLTFGDSCLFIGSCFSQEISSKGRQYGLSFEETLWGTVFHPEAIRRLLDMILNQNFDRDLMFEKESRWFFWLGGTKFFAESKQALENKINDELHRLLNQLKFTKALFVTFGSAWGYRHKALDLVVSNCHQQAQQLFCKELMSLDSMIDDWKTLLCRLREINPDMRTVFTVSPVRHKRDGLIENNRSKSRLLMLCEALEKYSGGIYFPSYELVIDQLRDYRFFKEDMVHPNPMAVQEVWHMFESVFLDPMESELRRKVFKTKGMLSHLSDNPELLQRQFEIKKASLTQEDSRISWV